MIPLARRQQILKQVDAEGIVSITDLVKALGVSHMTVRRDLQKLEQEGYVIQVSGGVRMLRKLYREPQLSDRKATALAEKARIAKAAAARVHANASVFLDAGTTALATARELAPRTDLTIISNDFEVLSYLAGRTESVIVHTGGTVRKNTLACVGTAAAYALDNYTVDIAFVSTSSWDERGITTPDPEKILLKKKLAEVSMATVLITDASKFGQMAAYVALPLTAFTAIITDTGLTETARQSLSRLKLDLQLV